MEPWIYYITFVESSIEHHIMNHSFISKHRICPKIVLFLSLIAITSCHNSKKSSGEEPVTLSLSQNLDVKTSDPIKVEDLIYTVLSNDSQDAFFKKANIIDVVGDTVILLEDTPQVSRLIMYNITNGEYLGQMNHRGQGPGEYNTILGAFVDRAKQSVMLPDFNSSSVNVYSLVNDSLENIINREYIPTVAEPIGSIESGINVAVPNEDGLHIMQYDGNYVLSDSIHIPGFQAGNFSMLWANAGSNAMVAIVDTVYEILPGRLNQVAIVDRGNYSITPEVDEKIIRQIIESSEPDTEILKPYLLIRNIQYTDDKFLVTTMHDAKKYSDLYDMTTGNLIYRNTYSSLEKPSYIVIENADKKLLHVENLFAKNGTWYGIISEELLPEAEDLDIKNTNCALVRFRF